MNPIVFFENFFALGNPTASSAVPGFPVANIRDWRKASPYRWRVESLLSGQWAKIDLGVGGENEPQALAWGGHNWNAAGARAVVEWSDDDAAWTPIYSTNVPADGRPGMVLLPTSGGHRYWRVSLSTLGGGNFTAQPEVGILTLGRVLVLDGLKPNLDPLNEEFETNWPANRGGEYLGSNYKYSERRYELAYGDVGILKEFFIPTGNQLGWDTHFKIHARDKPFWFSWNLSLDPTRIDLCRMEGFEAPFHVTTKRHDLFATFIANVDS